MSVVNQKTLEERAAELYKDNPRLQEKWLEAVAKTRASKRGWILDKQVAKIQSDN